MLTKLLGCKIRYSAHFLLTHKKTYVKNILQEHFNEVQQKPADNLQVLFTALFQRPLAHKQLTIVKVAFTQLNNLFFVI